MEQSARPGDMLADRYQLVDLLTESAGGRFWRAEDRVLDRHVALHCIAADDPRASRLTEAARLSATVLDRRILRVLDADESGGTAYVVNEWGSGISLDIMVGSEGPLPPRRAAWIVSEVAASMAAAHAQRVAHGRLVPENVLIDQTGSVRVIGFCVDAALMGLPPGEISTDVTDLGGLLYYLLTGRWAGTSRTAVPTAIHDDGRWLRPRRVRAGIPRLLDSICDHVLNPFDAAPAVSDHNLSTARGIADALRDYVGDPAGLIEPAPLNGVRGAGALAVPERREHPRGAGPAAAAGAAGAAAAAATPGDATVGIPESPDRSAETAAPAGPDGPDDADESDVTDTADDLAAVEADRADQADQADQGDDEGATAEPEPTLVVPTVPPPPPAVGEPDLGAADPAGPADRDAPDVDAGATGPVGRPATPGDVPTQAGMPIFDDATGDVDWLERRTEPPPPPPELEDPPERPLFAPEPADGGPVRRPRPGTSTATSGGGDFWPWDTGTGAGSGSGVIPVTEDEGDDRVPGRSWLRLAGLVAASLLLVVAMVVAYNLGRGKTPLGSEPEPESTPTGETSPSEAALEPLEAVSARDLDPQGDPPEENRDLAPLAVDGDPGTGWRTSTYNDQLGPPPGLKTGVGLYADLGESRDVSEIELTLAGAPAEVTYYLTDREPGQVADLEPLAQETLDGPSLVTELEEPATGRFLVVWFTSLPEVEDGFRGEIVELVARG